MSAILDALKERLENAKARVITAQQVYQAAQAELQAASAELGIWNSAVNLEMREEEKRTSEAREKQIPMDLGLAPSPIAKAPDASEGNADTVYHPTTTNKTERVREILREHATGITPSGLWVELRDQLSSRPYLYSILKRLRDSDEVYVRRGKYILKPQPFEPKAVETEEVTVQ